MFPISGTLKVWMSKVTDRFLCYSHSMFRSEKSGPRVNKTLLQYVNPCRRVDQPLVSSPRHVDEHLGVGEWK